jgi:lactoylglutathione lyase
MSAKHPGIRTRHVALNVSDLDVSEGFYQEVLGLRVEHESLHRPLRDASMGRDGEVVLTLWELARKRTKKRSPGLHHLAFKANSAEEINRTKEILADLGARWSEGNQLYRKGAKSVRIYFKDPRWYSD